ncbi:SRPBCC family protein [Nocardia sp. NPDC055321]
MSNYGARIERNDMVRLHTTGVIERPVDQVFEYVADYRRLTEWVFGITRVRSVGNTDYGPGAVYEGAVDLGPKTLSATARISEWEENRVIGLESVAGFEFTATLQLRAQATRHTALAIELVYGTSGGVAAKAVARGLEPLLAMAARHTTEKLCAACTAAAPAR